VGINHPKKAAANWHSGNNLTNIYQETPKPRGGGEGARIHKDSLANTAK